MYISISCTYEYEVCTGKGASTLPLGEATNIYVQVRYEYTVTYIYVMFIVHVRGRAQAHYRLDLVELFNGLLVQEIQFILVVLKQFESSSRLR
jgi:hypothetical protein